ncbi:hypothetical protein [Butyricimonas paravirosa]|uniref:hypothetical protein n=1 Tax=Butyricimonas paravirosa TaxID=1472417 RepID=UPI002A7FDB21|nr:hypothetical protein [Butyricimonas paravirosa]
MKSILLFLVLFTFTQINGQTTKDKKNIYESTECYVERINAENFNYEDEEIKFNIESESWWWNIKIENKTHQEMTILWDKALFVVNEQSAGFMYYLNLDYISFLSSEEIIAPHSYIEKECTNTILRGRFILDNRIIKKTGEDYYIRLIIPIEVNGEVKKYDFKYRVSLINAKKQQKYKEKRQKKIKKELEKVIKQHQE